MKKTLSFLLAVLMVLATLPVFLISAGAATYEAYNQNFDGLADSSNTNDVLHKLGWYIPASEEGRNTAKYTITSKKLRVNTVGCANNSFVTILGGEVMSRLRTGSYTLSYDMTYVSGSMTAAAGKYAGIAYNYNEAISTGNNYDDSVAYGIATIPSSASGGFNQIVYPYNTTKAETKAVVSTAFTGSNLGTKMTIKLDYNVKTGMKISIGGTAKSTPSGGLYWNDFVNRTDGAAIALLVTPNVVVDIDNIKLTATSFGNGTTEGKAPDLIITELAASGVETKIKNVVSGTDKAASWLEYIELTNASDKNIDLRDYVVTCANLGDMTAKNSSGVVDPVPYTPERIENYFKKDSSGVPTTTKTATVHTGQLVLANFLGTDCVNTKNYYKTAEELKKIGTSRYTFVDSGASLTGGTRYVHKGGDVYTDSNFTASSSGTLIKVKYKDTWNSRYKSANNSDSSKYDTNTILKPGQCVMIYTILNSEPSCFEYGVNAHENSAKTISTKTSFRQFYQQYGLSEDTKVIAEAQFNLADNYYRRYSVGKRNNSSGTAIDYLKVNVTDLTNIISYCDFVSTMIAGIRNGGNDPSVTDSLGNAGRSEVGYSACYIYGADASVDYRAGTLYMGRNRITKSTHVGVLSGYQKAMVAAMKSKNAKTLAITEIAPRTNDLKGEDNNAFPAIELTNVSSSNLNLYEYALLRTELGGSLIRELDEFTRTSLLKAGNPVNKGANNGAYYYFMEEHISNPETCVLAPGESVVIWLMSHDAFDTYRLDDDFGTDYFRQYWAGQGNTALAAKNENGEFSTKVIVADGNDNAMYNRDNADRVVGVSYTDSAIYGVAMQSTAVMQNKTDSSVVLSAAYLGPVSTYFYLKETVQELDGVNYVFQELEYKAIPANLSMDYVAIRNGVGVCSGMTRSLRVLHWEFPNDETNYIKYYKVTNGVVSPLYTVSADKPYMNVVGTAGVLTQTKVKPFQLRMVTNNCALSKANLGELIGKSAVALGSSLFYPTATGSTTYKYYGATPSIKTLQGAGLNTSGTTAKLRFDHAIPANAYYSLAAMYGTANCKVGAIIVDASLVKTSIFTKDTLDQAGVEYVDVTGVTVSQNDDYVVIGTSLEITDTTKYDSKYKAVGYVQVTLADGSKKVFWSDAVATGSVRQVATNALFDLKDLEEPGYKHATASGFFSRYSESEQAVLQGFKDA